MIFTLARSGYGYVVVAAVLWAISGAASKFLFMNGISALHLVQLRITLALTVLFLWLVITQPALLKITREDLPYFFLLGVILASAQFTYLYAISKIQVAAAILLQYQAPVFVVLYSVAVGRKKIRPVTFASLAGALAGCYLVVGAYDVDVLNINRMGIIAGLASAVAFAWYSVQSEYGMDRYSPWTVLVYALLFAAPIWNIFQPPLEAFARPYSTAEWGWIVFIAVFGTVFAFGFYNKGVRQIQSAHASITATLEPITAAVISYLFLNEVMEVYQFIGAAMVIASISLLQIRRLHA